MGDDRDAAIKVAVRCRVFLPFEIKQGNTESVVNVLPNDSIKIQPPQITSLDESRYQFTFDATYGSNSTQADVFNRSIRPLVDSCLEGYNATCIAYGQTGSGKTHTILGQTDQSDHTVPPEKDMSEAGVIPRALRALFRSLMESRDSSTEKKRYEYNVKVQFLELYGEDIRDLLQTDPNKAPKLSIRDGSTDQEPEVLGIKSVDVDSAEEALLCLTRGTLRRVTRATAMNAESSRSHAIMTVLVEQKTIKKVQSEDGNLVDETASKSSKFHFVDLAGSERIKRTHATGQGVKEGININKGLLILGNVISALASQGKKKDAFVPYRDSKLTRLLKGSLGGNHKTLMIACVSPSGSNTEESLNTLRYANRAKNIQNRAVINMDAGSKMIADLRAQLKAMAAELLRVRSMVAKGVVLDEEGAIFTESVLLAIAGGFEVNLNMEELASKPVIKKAEDSSAAASEQTVSTAPSTVSSVAKKRDKKTASIVGNDDSDELKKAKEEIAKLRRALEKSDDRVLEAQRQLEWMKEELKISKEEVMALAAVEKSSDGDSSASNVSALTEDFENMPRLSQETYETVKNIYEEKLVQMTFELKEREEERDNIAMTLYRHESDSQRLLYVKNTLTEDLQRKEEQIAHLKQELRDMSNVTVVSTGTPQAERQFRRLRGRISKKPPKNANSQMSSYYTEKLNKIERHIKLREEECINLGKELGKLEADSQIFTDLAKDLSDRLNAKDKELTDMKGKTKDQLKKLGVVIEKNQEERDQLQAELERLKGDSETFLALVKALTEERKTKLEHVEKYKKRHREMATSIGLTSPYKETADSGSGGDDADDDASVSSTWSLMSVDTVATSTSGFNPNLTMTKIDYDQKISQLEANITKHEEDRVFILNDLEKLEADTHAFRELSTALKDKLRAKEDQVVQLKKELDEFAKKLDDQANELAMLSSSKAAAN
mmetsp:Transcript_15336/g.28881  ORF Transcript_15336/g.28881 Transcript_15336/m.28881 type:complete len:949 (-) Transcript_15336:145-2991(-)